MTDDAAAADPMALAVERMLELVGRPGTPLADAALWHLVVERNESLTDEYRRITFRGSGLGAIAYQPGQDLMLRIPTVAGSVANRRYTIRRADRARDSVDVDVVVHGDGPGARWASAAEPGAELDAIGPRGSVRLSDDATWHLFIGDETALPGMLAMVEALPPALPAIVVTELPRVVVGHQPTLPDGSAAELVWLERGDAPPGAAERLVAAAAEVAWPAPGPGHAYIAGEMRVVREVAAVLERRGLNRDQLSPKAYWRRGGANAAHGEPLEEDRPARIRRQAQAG